MSAPALANKGFSGYAKRVDRNQAEIVEALRGVGAWVQVTSAVGQGFPDLLVWYRGYYLLEVKTEDGKLTQDQVQFHGSCKGPIHVVRSVDEALRAIKAV